MSALDNVEYERHDMPNGIQLALQSLLRDQSIIIKPADKNLGTCVVGSDWYERTALEQLSDTDTYKELHTPPCKSTCYNELEAILRKYDCFVHTNTNTKTPLAKYIMQLQDQPMKLGRFYMTIKVHKTPVTGRPICASIGTITYHASKYLDHVLQPAMKMSRSYIKDSFAIIERLSLQRFPSNCTIVTADVESLYPSIITEDGLAALNVALTALKLPSSLRELYVELTRWVLTHNYLQFGKRMFHQIRGTAMGTPLAVSYANISLMILEQRVLRSCKIQKPLFKVPLLYKRFIDDVFSIFEDADDGSHFITEFNAIRPGIIRLTHQISSEEGVFLDLTIYKGQNFAETGYLSTKLYQKPMNKYVYLHYKSCHSERIKRGFIVSEMKRYCISCSLQSDYITAVDAFRSRLLARGYPPNVLDQWMDVKLDREQLIRERIVSEIPTDTSPIKASPPLIFKIEYTPRTIALKLNECLAITEDAVADPDYNTIFGNRRPILCLTRTQNLSDLLVRSTFS